MATFVFTFLSFLLAFIDFSFASPVAPSLDKRYIQEKNGIKYNVFEHAATGAKLEFVKNSGVCETTPGVNQYSGYLSVGQDMNMFFWFFESRNDPANAPLAAWFNGGPGCSSMIGLFQEHGPCQFYNGAAEPSLNPYSFNEFANMIYIDQPIDVGFSYGTNDVDSTPEAATEVWKLLQAFHAQFPEYKSRDFGIFTESYGGMYGPSFANYILDQNAKIKAGTVQGDNINLVALGINNGWTDPYIALKSQVDYAYNNSYKKLITATQYSRYSTAYEQRCKPALDTCARTKTNSDCSRATLSCNIYVESPIAQASDFNVYDIRLKSKAVDPPETYLKWLNSANIKQKIGAKSNYVECANTPGNKIRATGDDARSMLPSLSNVVKAGVTTLIWSGDADWICNWFGNLNTANAVDYPGHNAFSAKSLAPFTTDGKKTGEFKQEGKLSYLRVYQAGHELMYYQPAVALQVFRQTMSKTPIAST